MSEVTFTPQGIFDQVAGAFDEATTRVAEQVGARQVHKSGKLAASYGVSATQDDGQVWWVYVKSPLPYARPVEKGAYVKGRRGPHMRGNAVVKKTVQATYGAAIKAALPKGLKPRRTTMRPLAGYNVR